MAEPFADYSRYYDLLYQDKDYAGEAKYIASLVSRFSENARSLLELGCGTGKHALLLSQMGYDVVGVDRSSTMIQSAHQNLASVNLSRKGSVRVLQGDAQSVRLNQKFDCILSLFHVVSYQTTNDEAAAVFATASSHLKNQGVFIFDVWYGPAVLTQTPAVRVKRIENDVIKVTRIAEPKVDFNQNLVDVNYDVTVTDKATGQRQQFSESHRMRYFFAPELELFAKASGMTIIHSESWMDGSIPSANTWGVTFVAKKTADGTDA